MSAIDIKSPAQSTSLTQDLYINNVNVGAVSYQTPIFVNLQDVATTPVTPISVSKPANVATVTLPTPAPAGVALQFPTTSQYTSYATGDIGWRTQNGWFDYIPPTYPAKYAELDTAAGANSWYKLKTALTVGGVTSTERFVDINGVQGWGLVGNANSAVIDKLTGLMFTRGLQSWGGLNWSTQNTNALSYSVVINGITYSDWYLMSLREYTSIFGMFLTGTNWNDPISGLTITPSLANGGAGTGMWLSDAVGDNSGSNKILPYIQLNVASITNAFQNDARQAVRVHKAYNLIS